MLRYRMAKADLSPGDDSMDSNKVEIDRDLLK